MTPPNHTPGTDPQPDRGKDNEHGHGEGRSVKPSPSAPLPTKQLSETNFEFWHVITKR